MTASVRAEDSPARPRQIDSRSKGQTREDVMSTTNHSLGKAEVVSSILTGSTILFNKLDHPLGGKPCPG